MGLGDFLKALFAFRFDLRVWSEPCLHYVGDTLRRSQKEKDLKQIGRILRFADVPDKPGIYLIREYTTEPYLYIGQSGDLGERGIRVRLTEHLSGRGCSSIMEGVLYEIRWADTSKSGYGDRAEQVAEALAILYFDPIHNRFSGATDWITNLRRERAIGRSNAILAEAKRLGFLNGSRAENEDYIAKIMNV
jgi:hypothetical protein